MEGIKESLQRALDSLPVPRPGPSPDGISIEVMPSISKISCYIRYRSSFLRFVYTISNTNLRYRSMLNTISVKTYSISMFCIYYIEGNVEKYWISYVLFDNIEY